MEDEEADSYTDLNRAFLQAFIARSTLTYEEAKPVIASIISAQRRREYLAEDVTEALLNHFVASANNAISPFDYEIRSTFHQTSRRRVYALINSTSDPLTQLATVHTPDEIGFLKRLLDAMFETYNTRRHEIMAITSMQAIGLAKPPSDSRRETQNGSETQGSAGQGLTMTQAEKMLKSLVEEGWFEKSRKGYYSLSPRALMELRGWLLETYNDEEDDEGDGRKIKTCFGCKEIITTGQRCAQRNCICRLHDICIQQVFRSQPSRVCPLCKADWTGTEFVGEKAAAGFKDKAKRRGGANGSAIHRTSTTVLEGDENGIDASAVPDEDESEG